jgi:hypothetical protein
MLLIFYSVANQPEYDIAYEIGQGDAILTGTVPSTDLSVGEYEVSWTIDPSLVSDCGPIAINTYIMDTIPGLTAKYFTNRWFAGTPAYIRKDKWINFDWRSNQGISESVSYTSIEWTGYIKPQYTETYTFTIESSGGVSLSLNNILQIDKLDWTPVDESEMRHIVDISLTTDELIPIQIKYADTTGSSFVVLRWESTSQAEEIIESSLFSPPYPITAITNTNSVSVPSKVLRVAQGDASTYAIDSITIDWDTPLDDN